MNNKIGRAVFAWPLLPTMSTMLALAFALSSCCDSGGVGPQCGNGVMEQAEQCDGTDFPPGLDSCQAYGFAGGTISCDSSCMVNVDGCTL